MDKEYQKYLCSLSRSFHFRGFHGCSGINSENIVENEVDAKVVTESFVWKVDEDYAKCLELYRHKIYDDDDDDNNVHVRPSAVDNSNQNVEQLLQSNGPQRTVSKNDDDDNIVHVGPSAADSSNQNVEPLLQSNAPQRTVSKNIQAEQVLEDQDYQNCIDSLVNYTNHGENGSSIRSVDVGDANDTPHVVIDNNDHVKPYADDNILENLSLDGDSYAPEVRLENGISQRMRYEVVEALPDEVQMGTPDILESFVNKNTSMVKKTWKRTSNEVNIEDLNSSDSLSSREIQSPTSLRHKRKLTTKISKPVKRRKCLAVKRATNVEFSGLVLSQKNVPPEVRPSSEVTDSDKFERNLEAEDDEIDKGYLEILDFIEREGENVVFEPKYERDEEEDHRSQSDAEITLLDRNPFCVESVPKFARGRRREAHKQLTPPRFEPLHLQEGLPSVEMDSDSDSIEENPDTCSSQFKEALMATIRRPYDYDEYLDLQKIVGCHRRIDKDYHLRGIIKTCPSDKLAKSHLEMYPALAREVDLAGHGKHKALVLYRGFFYWLQNNVHESVPLRYVLKMVSEAKVEGNISN